MRVLFYHNISVNAWHQAWREGRCPGHVMYGFTHLEKHGMECFSFDIPFDPYKNRFRLMCYVLLKVLSLHGRFDVIYAGTHRGLELVIFLRALGLIREPIVVWHHTAVVSSPKKWREALSKLFYKGMDRLFFFSEPLLERSLRTGKVAREKAALIHWGADLHFYDKLREKRKPGGYYISTGRENRDFVTLIRAFNRTRQVCEIYTTVKIGENDYREILRKQLDEPIADNVHLFFVETGYLELAEKVNDAKAVVICSFDRPYTVGLTTLVEAMALGLPVITTDNKNYPVDVAREGIGLSVPFEDPRAWVDAIDYLETHPEETEAMGRKSRSLAEHLYNLERFTGEVAAELRKVCEKGRTNR